MEGILTQEKSRGKMDAKAIYFVTDCLNSGKRHAGSFSIWLLVLSPLTAFVLNTKLL